ncbi:partial PE-PGRS family protein PE_PGRS18, partial [Anaerolineae bacterium]
SADGSKIYVTNTQGDSVSVIDAHTLRQRSTIQVDTVPEGIGYSPANHKIYVASWGDNTVSVIDANSNKRLASIPTGKQSRAFGSFIATAPH